MQVSSSEETMIFSSAGRIQIKNEVFKLALK